MPSFKKTLLSTAMGFAMLSGVAFLAAVSGYVHAQAVLAEPVTDIEQYATIAQLDKDHLHLFVQKGSFNCPKEQHRAVMLRVSEPVYIAMGCAAIDETKHVLHVNMEYGKTLDIPMQADEKEAVPPLSPERGATHPGVVHAG